MPELQQYVQFLNDKSSYYHQQFYINAWQKIADNKLEQFQFSSKNPSEIYQSCVHYLHTIQTCPVLPALQFQKAIEILFEANREEFVAVLLQYVTEGKEQLAKVRLKK